MNKSNNKTQSNRTQSKEGNALNIKPQIVHLNSVFQSILKRIKFQAIYWSLSSSHKHKEKENKLKMLLFFARRTCKEKKQEAFNKLRRYTLQGIFCSKSVNLLKHTVQRLRKNKLKYVINELKKTQVLRISESVDNRRSSLSIKSAKQSSNLLSASRSSIFSSRALIPDQNRNYSKEEITNIRRQNQQLKKMLLSEQARESLMKMQRFDRYIYHLQSQKMLKQPISNQLKRLERMKNEYKQMRSKFYDNQLTITCLFNHVKLLSELNKDMNVLNAVKYKNLELQKKISEMSAQHRKEISEYKKKLLFVDAGKSKEKGLLRSQSRQSKSKQQEKGETQLSNQELVVFNSILNSLGNKNYLNSRRQIDLFLKKSNKDKFIIIFKHISLLLTDLQAYSQQQKTLQKSQQQTSIILTHLNKMIIGQKWQQIQRYKVKNKLASATQFIPLVDSILNISKQLNNLRKMSDSVEKREQKKIVSKQNQQLKMVITKLQKDIQKLQLQKTKLQQNLRKSRLSLPPKRPNEKQQIQSSLNDEKERLLDQNLKVKNEISKLKQENDEHAAQIQRMKQQQSLLKSRIRRLQSAPKTPEKSRQSYQSLRKQNERLRQQIDGLKSRITHTPRAYLSPIMQLQQSKSSSKNNQNYQKARQLQDFIKCYEEIKVQRQRNLQYFNIIEFFRNDYPYSIFVEILAFQQNLQNNIKILLQENNRIKQILFKERQEYQRLQKQSKQLRLQLQQKTTEISAYVRKQEEVKQSSCIQSVVPTSSKLEIYQGKLTKKEQNKAQNNRSKQEDRKIADIQSKLVACQQKLDHYQFMLEKVKAQRNNFKNLYQQKNQQYELLKENQQKNQQNKIQNESKISFLELNLKHAQQSFNKVSQQLQAIVRQKTIILTENKEKQEKLNAIIENLQTMLHNLQSCNHQIQSQLQSGKNKFKVDFSRLLQQRNYLLSHVQNLQQTQKILQQQVQQYKRKIDRFTTEIDEYQRQKQFLRQKVNQFTRLTEYVPTHMLIQDHEKQQLRKQLDLINGELANCIRNNQNQLRQSRRYIEKLINQIQQKNAFSSEEKRILRQQIQRARNQQYQINQQKIRKLRDDIQSLRLQNQRLISIIDSNQAPFNQLIEYHKQLSQNIIHLQQVNKSLHEQHIYLNEANNHLQQAITQSENEKQQLINQLQNLEQRMIEFENRVVQTINQGETKQQAILRCGQQKITQLQSIILTINSQKAYLSQKNEHLRHELMQRHQELLALQIEMVSRKQQLQRSNRQTLIKTSQYSKFLQESIQQKNYCIKEYQERQITLVSKIQNSNNLISQLEIQKLRLESTIFDLQTKSSAEISNLWNNLENINMQLNKAHQTIRIKDNEICKQKEIAEKNKEKINELEQQIKVLAHPKDQIIIKNVQLQASIQNNNKRMISHQQFQQIQIIKGQNRHLSIKITNIETQNRQIHHRYLHSLSRIRSLEDKLQKSIKQLEPHKITQSLQANLKEQLSWYKGHLKSKQEELHHFRNKLIQMQNQSNKLQGLQSQFLELREKYYRQNSFLLQTKEKLRTAQHKLQSLTYLKSKQDQKFHRDLSLKQQQLIEQSKQIEQLKQRYHTLQNRLSSSKSAQRQFLIQIAQQLDQNYRIDAHQQQVQLMVLQKISTEIGELIQINHQYKQKYDFLQKEGYEIRLQEVQANISLSIRLMFIDLIQYLKSNQLTSLDVPQIQEQSNIEDLILQVGSALKHIFCASFKNNEDEVIKYNNIIRNIRVMISEVYNSKDLQSLNRLRILLIEAN